MRRRKSEVPGMGGMRRQRWLVETGDNYELAKNAQKPMLVSCESCSSHQRLRMIAIV